MEERAVDVGLPRNVELRMALTLLDDVDTSIVVRQRGAVMRTVLHFLRSSFRNAMKPVLEEATWGNCRSDAVRQERRWKLFMLLPGMLLHGLPDGGLNPKDKLVCLFQMFARGKWIPLLQESAVCDEKAASARHRKTRRGRDEIERRVTKAERLVELGELSSARQALERAAVALSNQATLDMLQDVRRRLQQPRERLTPEMLTFQPDIEIQFDEKMFGKNLRSSKRGVAGGQSGMTTEHLRLLLDDVRATHMFFRLGENLARAQVSEVAVAMVRFGRMTALSKDDGGVRGIVIGYVVRLLVARTIAQQLGPAVKAATARHQYAFSTRAGCECVAHAIQAFVRIEPTGHSHFSGWHWSVRLHFEKSHAGRVDAGRGRQCHHRIRADVLRGSIEILVGGRCRRDPHHYSGRGGGQGDAMMPLFFALGQHGALEATARTLNDGEFMFAFLDDIYSITEPNRVGAVYATLQEALWAHARIAIHLGKTKVWNSSGVRFEICTVLERIAHDTDRSARVWRGSEIPEDKQGMKI